VEGWVNLGTAVELHNLCPRLYSTVVVAINTRPRWASILAPDTLQSSVLLLDHCDLQWSSKQPMQIHVVLQQHGSSQWTWSMSPVCSLIKPFLLYSWIMSSLHHWTNFDTLYFVWCLSWNRAFWGHVDTAARWEDDIPQNTHFQLCIFKPNSQNIRTCILSKLLHWFQTNFA